MAQEVLRHGLKIPQDLSVAGFGNLGLEFAQQKKIATVRMDNEGLGVEAARLLLAQLKGEDLRPQRILLPTQVLANDSVGRCPDPEAQHKILNLFPETREQSTEKAEQTFLL